MKITAIILAILCVASLMVLGYLYFTSDIAVTWELARDEKGNNGIQVIQRPEQFEAVREAMAGGSFDVNVVSRLICDNREIAKAAEKGRASMGRQIGSRAFA